jgi:hypothetical protein
MRMLMAFIALWLAGGAAAQPAEAPESARRRAPLANVEDLEPAVDVGCHACQSGAERHRRLRR